LLFVCRRRISVLVDIEFFQMHLPWSCLALLSLASYGTSQWPALTEVDDFGDNPTGIRMSIYLPPKLPAKAPVILAVGSTITSLF